MDQLIFPQLVKKFLAFYGTSSFLCPSHTSPPLVPLLTQINSVHRRPSYYFKIHFNIILCIVDVKTKVNQNTYYRPVVEHYALWRNR
jgi:hypothetical protein